MNIDITSGEKIDWEKVTIANRPGAKSCANCGKKFVKNELFAVRETKISWFRGEDEVDFFCKECTPEPIRKVLKLT